MIPSHGRLSDPLVRREGQDCDGTWWIRLLLGHCPPDRRGTTPLLGWPTRQCKDTKSVILWVRPAKAATTRSISEQGCFPRKDPRNHTNLKAKQRALRADFPETMGLRVHRSISWIGRAEAAQDDPDAQFLCKPSFRPWTGDSEFILQIESRPHRGPVTCFAMRYRRLHGGSRRGFWRRSDAGRG